MKPIIYWLQRNLSNINKTILVLISIFLLVQLFPRQAGFDYEYQQARPWLYDDLIAPFSFAILKSNDQLQDERKAIEESFAPFFSLSPSVGNIIMDDFESSFEEAWEEKHGESNNLALKQQSKDVGLRILSDLYNTGIIFLEEELRKESSDFRIMLLEDNVARSKTLDHFFTIQDAFIFAITELDEVSDDVDVQLLQSLLESSLRHNVFYNEELTDRTLRAELDEIPVTRGMVQQGEKIISKGELITPSAFQILESFKSPGKYFNDCAPAFLKLFQKRCLCR